MICFSPTHSSNRIPFRPAAILQNSQIENPPIFRLYKLEGTYSEELSTNPKSSNKQNPPGFSVVSARLENDGMGALAKLRSTLTIVNEASRRITEVEWLLDIFDASIGNASNSVAQSEKKNIYPGETANVSARFARSAELCLRIFRSSPKPSPHIECEPFPFVAQALPVSLSGCWLFRSDPYR